MGRPQLLHVPLFFYAAAVSEAFQITSSPSRIISRGSTSLPLGSRNDDEATNPAGELTSTLARLDQQWKIQQSTKKAPSRWKTLRLDDDNTMNDNNEIDADDIFLKNKPIMQTPPAYLLEPPNQSVPSCMIVFIGGAGLGSYPQIAYNELLLRISDRLNAAIVAAPYQVGLDHFALAQDTCERARRAVEYCQTDASYLYPDSIPVYALSHSLGGKLTAIHMAATSQDYAGIGMISFNNFGFGKTIGMAKEFAQEIQSGMQGSGQSGGGGGGMNSRNNNELFDTLFNFAETAVSSIGIDFSPNTEQMEKLISLKYDQEWQSKTRLITFDEDNLQSTQEFVQACSGSGPDVSELTGTHLTPVYFELGLDQIPDVDAQNMAREAMGGLEKASFGVEEQLNELVDEICSWILGKEPSQRPAWKREPPMIVAASEES